MRAVTSGSSNAARVSTSTFQVPAGSCGTVKDNPREDLYVRPERVVRRTVRMLDITSCSKVRLNKRELMSGWVAHRREPQPELDEIISVRWVFPAAEHGRPRRACGPCLGRASSYVAALEQRRQPQRLANRDGPARHALVDRPVRIARRVATWGTQTIAACRSPSTAQDLVSRPAGYGVTPPLPITLEIHAGGLSGNATPSTRQDPPDSSAPMIRKPPS